MAGLLDSLFNSETYGGQQGGLLEFLRNMQMQNSQYQPSAGFAAPVPELPPAQTIAPAPQPVAQPPQNYAPPQGQMPTDVSAQSRQPQPQPQQGNGGGNNLMAGFQSWANTEPGNIIGGIANGIQGFTTGQRSDPAGIALQNQSAQFRAFQEAGLTPSQAMIAISHPKIAEELMKKLSPTYSAHNVGNTALVFNPATGAMQPAYTEPKYEKLGPGENLISVGAGGKTSQIASGGPEKPPADYTWNVPGDPSKGMTAIEGSAATRLPEGSAGRMAMMEVAEKALPEARAVLMKDRGAVGLFGLRTTGNPGIQSVAGTGEVGRAQRSIRLAVEAALRASTGQAAPETEVVRYADMFTPSATDSRETATQKLNQLEDFMAAHKELATRGRGGKANSGVPSDPLEIRNKK